MIKKFYDNPIFVFFVLFFFIPQPSVSTGAILRVTGLSIYIIYFLVKNSIQSYLLNEKDFFENYKFEIMFLTLYILYELLLLFIQPLTKSNLTYTLRPIFFALIFLFSLMIYKTRELDVIRKELLSAIYVVFIIQYIISTLQLFDMNFLSFLYIDEKSFPLGRLVRLTGTLGNPNIFAWYIGQFTLIVLLFEIDKIKKYLFLILGLIFTVLTGSRTMLVVTPVIWVSTYSLYWFIKSKNIKIIFIFLGSIIAIFLGIVGLLYSLQSVLPYASQLLNVLKSGLSGVNSFNLRLIKWNEELSLLNKDSFNWIFGFRTARYISVDNDILYGITRSGIIGLFLQYIFYLLILFRLLFYKLKNKMTAFLIVSIIFTFLIGLQADTYMGWYYPVFQLLFFGDQLILNDYRVR